MKKSCSFATPRFLVRCAAAPLILAILTGCATHSTNFTRESQSEGTTTAIDIPNFSGEWASDFERSYRQASSDFERTILEDGVITDAEFAETEATFKKCLSGHRIGFEGYQRDGSYDYQAAPGADPVAVNDEVNECVKSSGARSIGTLYFAMIRNPQNRDEGEIMSACLVKKQVLPTGYGAEDYYRDAPTGVFPFVGGTSPDAILDECISDPLGLTREQNDPTEITER